jgi:hypothetical protein
VLEGGPAESGVLEATISAAPEQLGGAVLRNIIEELSHDISQTPGLECSAVILRSAPKSPLPVGGGKGRYPSIAEKMNGFDIM